MESWESARRQEQHYFSLRADIIIIVNLSISSILSSQAQILNVPLPSHRRLHALCSIYSQAQWTHLDMLLEVLLQVFFQNLVISFLHKMTSSIQTITLLFWLRMMGWCMIVFCRCDECDAIMTILSDLGRLFNITVVPMYKDLLRRTNFLQEAFRYPFKNEAVPGIFRRVTVSNSSMCRGCLGTDSTIANIIQTHDREPRLWLHNCWCGRLWNVR